MVDCIVLFWFNANFIYCFHNRLNNSFPHVDNLLSRQRLQYISPLWWVIFLDSCLLSSKNHNCLNMDLIQLRFASRDLRPYGAHLGFSNRFFPNIALVICIHYLSSWLETTGSFNRLLQGLFFCFGRNSPLGKRWICFFGLFSTYSECLVPGPGSQETELVAVLMALSGTSVKLF